MCVSCSNSRCLIVLTASPPYDTLENKGGRSSTSSSSSTHSRPHHAPHPHIQSRFDHQQQSVSHVVILSLSLVHSEQQQQHSPRVLGDSNTLPRARGRRVSVCSLILCSLTHSLTHSPTHSSTPSLTHSLAHSLTHSLARSLTRSL